MGVNVHRQFLCITTTEKYNSSRLRLNVEKAYELKYRSRAANPGVWFKIMSRTITLQGFMGKVITTKK